MKPLSLLLSVIFAVLACIPCADAATGSACQSESRSATEKKCSDSEKSNDLCSPFCICNCCAANVLSFSTPASIPTVIVCELPVKQETFYKEPAQKDFSKSIWQPPQLV